jgi:hypothetical protein
MLYNGAPCLGLRQQCLLRMMLREVTPKTGKVFSDTNLRVEWEKACDACRLGERTKMEPSKEGGFVWYKYKDCCCTTCAALL